MRQTSPKEFWDTKIIGWEQSRYGSADEAATPLEREAGRRSSSLRFRMSFAAEILSRHASGKHVLELGCGSGLLAETLLAAGAQTYTGVDIAPSAIAAGKARTQAKGLEGKAFFYHADVCGFRPDRKPDIVFSLGLLDWLDPEHMARVIGAYGKTPFLHSFSEKRLCASQLLHKIYVYIAYGRKTGAYVPRYYPASYILTIAKKHSAPGQDAKIIRDPRLSFGAFVHNLKEPD